MKTVKIVLTAVAEGKIGNGETPFEPEMQSYVLKKWLEKGVNASICGHLNARIRYASREVVDENDVAESAETLIADEPSGLFECFHCGERTVGWQSDFMFEDYGYEGNGIVQNLVCTNCGADIEYRVPIGPREE